MKNIRYALLTLLALTVGTSAFSQILRPFTARYSNTSEKGKIVFAANSFINSIAGNNGIAPPTGSDANNGRTATYIDVDSDPAVLFPFGSAWKYLDNNTRPAGWETSGYSDAAWATGNGELGYGDGDETTTVSYGGAPAIKYITTYFRKTINIPNPLTYPGFIMNMKRDDGIVVYINGTEVYRSNLVNPGAIAHGTLALVAVDGLDELVSVVLANTAFAAGNNVIAVEIHQQAVTSSDISFNMELRSNATTLIPIGATWNYSNANAEPTGWPNVTTLPSGPAAGPLGFGVIEPYPVMGTFLLDRNAYYFVKGVNIDPSLYSSFTFNLEYDDGAVVFVNGIEVGRFNMPAGDPGYATNSSANFEPEPTNNFTIRSGLPFVNGTNYIQVEVHKSAANESGTDDLVFNMHLVGNDPASTYSSSAAGINLPACSNVLWAGLYWGASQGTDGVNQNWITGETSCKLRIPGAGAYQTITSAQTDYHNNTLVPGLPHTGYRCFANITSLVNTTNPNGMYYVADMVGPSGVVNGSGGWTIVVVYANPSEPPRNLTVFDGSVIVNGGDPAVDVNISGFLTPPSPSLVSCELGAVIYDGDRGSTDAFGFRENGDPGFYDMATVAVPLNGAADAWNSKISHKGVLTTNRIPAYRNTLGYDASIFDLPNVGNVQLSNGQTSATIRISSPSENYFAHVLTTSISQFDPSFALEKGSTDVNGGTLVGGDIIRYRVNYTNVGNDASTNTIITDNIPIATSFVPGSININGVAKTDATADDEAEYDYVNRRVTLRIGTGANGTNGGSVASLAATGYIEFDVFAASSCTVLSCGTPTDNSARIDYNGQTSGLSLHDSSGYNLAGCLTQGPISNVITGSCYVPGDTTLINICPSTTVMLPIAAYAGYSFYSAMPFIPANLYNPSVPVPVTGPLVYYAYFNSGVGCVDTIRITILYQNCPDLDEDDDGIPDYLEINDPVALQDHDSDGIPNWNDTGYPGWVDNNTDGLNDNFDPGADSDNDGQVNFMEPGWPGFVDSNGDGINDTMDNDRDGIPNFLDRDSDNDGIPDVVESNGVDANGDGRIDNFTDPDSDGLSQNVDGASGVTGSGNGLGAVDTDGDGVPNYVDIDSDNDGIPDVVEVYGTDANNDGRIDGYSDSDFDGYNDSVDGDVGNDGIAENAANTLLRTGPDGNGDGRADSYPYNNMDADTKANPYDLDSDTDGITDVKEAGFADTDWNGRVDGTYNSDGWSTVIAAMSSLNLPNTDATGRADAYDIDSDDDGIPDNVEGQTTLGYLLPSTTDTDGDGIVDTYDNFNGFGGDGIHVYDEDIDGTPDYRDTDTDNDGFQDVIEGNDFNLNGLPDDNVTLTGTDTDGDGLDDRFDLNNSSPEGTSAFMGNGGTTSGDPSPGSNTTVQYTPLTGSGCPTERDWRCLGYVLNCEIINFKGNLQDEQSLLDWSILCRQEPDHFIIQRSIDGTAFIDAIKLQARATINETETYFTKDDVSGIKSTVIYYRLKSVFADGKINLSKIITILRSGTKNDEVIIFPNPVRDQLQVSINASVSSTARLLMVNANGRTIKEYTETIRRGSNTFRYDDTGNLPNGMYYLLINFDGKVISRKFSVVK